jgi:hypothetical protein
MRPNYPLLLLVLDFLLVGAGLVSSETRQLVRLSSSDSLCSDCSSFVELAVRHCTSMQSDPLLDVKLALQRAKTPLQHSIRYMGAAVFIEVEDLQTFALRACMTCMMLMQRELSASGASAIEIAERLISAFKIDRAFTHRTGTPPCSIATQRTSLQTTPGITSATGGAHLCWRSLFTGNESPAATFTMRLCEGITQHKPTCVVHVALFATC